MVAEERVDVVLVAGDVYDRAVPSADATAVLDRAVGRLRAAGAEVVLTPGNHDSARRLGIVARLLAAAGVHVRADARRSWTEPVLLADEHGEVAVYGLPYLEPEVARHELGVPGARSHAAVLDAAMARVRADLARRPGTRSRGAGARLRRRRPGQRERARHLRRRGRPGARGGLRRGRLRRARPPAPPADR